MTRHASVPLPAFLILLALLSTGCATTTTVLPGKALALIDVAYAEGRFDATAVPAGEEAPSSRVARALLRELGREGHYEVSDARNLLVRPAELGPDAARTAVLRESFRADAYLGVRLLGCGAWLMNARETRGAGASAVTVTVYWFAGECTAELKAFDPAGKTVASLLRTGRWDSQRKERAEGRLEQSEALENAVADLARGIAHEIRPAAPGRE